MYVNSFPKASPISTNIRPPNHFIMAPLRLNWSGLFKSSIRRLSTKPPPTPATTAQPSPPSPRALSRLMSRLPPRFRSLALHLRTAPGSHVVAFLALHEITAIVPLFGLFGAIHYAGKEWVPLAWAGTWLEPQLDEGMKRFEKYFQRKGWFGFGKEEKRGGEQDDVRDGERQEDALKTLREGEGGYRVVAELALAYVLTKALLPARIIVSLWATPWLARGIVRVQGLLRKPKQ